MNLFLAYTRNPAGERTGQYTVGDMELSSYDTLLNYASELEDLAQAQGVTLLSEFTDRDDGADPYPAAEGLKTVNALLAAIPETDIVDPDIIDVDELVEELTRLREELEMLHASGRGFKFGIA